MSNFESPIPLSEIESVLAWVDTFKLSRPTKKINRDFSDAVLLAEILNVHYPKLVEMHNYPPRNSHSLKLNNWMTLNRKVLKKLKLSLCCNTMEQLANCHNGIIERVLIMVRDKIRRDEDLNKSMKDSEQNMSSGGSFYEACGEDENVLVVPVKMRINGVLEAVQQKVVSHDSYLNLKEELKDARDSAELLKQKVEHLENLLKLKEQRIDELQNQLDRKQARRKEAESLCNSLQVPFEIVPSPVIPTLNDNPAIINLVAKTPSLKSVESAKVTKEDSKIPVKPDSTIKLFSNTKPSVAELILIHKEKQADIKANELEENPNKLDETTNNMEISHLSYTKLPAKSFEEMIGKRSSHFTDRVFAKPAFAEVIVNQVNQELDLDVDRIKSDVFKEVEIVEEKIHEYDEFKDSEQDTCTTIEETIKREISNINNPMEYNMRNVTC